jgi:hypothetical protein
VAYLLMMKLVRGGLFAVGVAGTMLAVAPPPARADSGPTMRFGLTGALEDQSAPQESEVGPMIGLGARLGPLVLEGDYAYLSMFDPDTGSHGMQRLGVNLRADVLRRSNYFCVLGMACTRGASLYAEAGIAERFGQWHLDSVQRYPADGDRTTEEHVGVGIELDNHVHPHRYGWQLGVRLAMAPHDPYMIDSACRGSCMPGTTTTTTTPTSKTGGQDLAVLLEWVFLLGR